MKIAVVSSEEEMSKTDLALGIIRDMIAAGLGETCTVMSPPQDPLLYTFVSFITNFVLQQSFNANRK